MGAPEGFFKGSRVAPYTPAFPRFYPQTHAAIARTRWSLKRSAPRNGEQIPSPS
jgi:hypothetical protein